MFIRILLFQRFSIVRSGQFHHHLIITCSHQNIAEKNLSLGIKQSNHSLTYSFKWARLEFEPQRPTYRVLIIHLSFLLFMHFGDCNLSLWTLICITGPFQSRISFQILSYILLAIWLNPNKQHTNVVVLHQVSFDRFWTDHLSFKVCFLFPPYQKILFTQNKNLITFLHQKSVIFFKFYKTFS